MVEDQGHLEFLNPRCALPPWHYITLIPLKSYNVPVCTLVAWVSYSRACKTGSRISRKILVTAKYQIRTSIGIYEILKDSDQDRIAHLIGTSLLDIVADRCNKLMCGKHCI